MAHVPTPVSIRVQGGDASTPQRATETLVLIDDDETVRAVMRRVLEREGYGVIEANDGDEALELVASYDGPIDLVITDAVMPGLTGRALLERLAAGRSPFKVLLVSGYPDYAVARAEVQELGVQFLEKPFEIADFVRTVRALLDDELPEA
jgi:DNA-binding NtrC family response regulator